MHIRQKVLKYSSVQKLEMFFVGLLAGAKAVSHTATTVRVDPALSAAFGLPGCAEQSVIAQTLNAATEQDVADLQAALGEIYGCYGQARRHHSNKSSWCSMWICRPCRQVSEQRVGTGLHGPLPLQDRAQTGARASGRHAGNHLGDGGVGPHRAIRLPVLQEAILAAEHLLGLEGESQQAKPNGRAPRSAWIAAGEARP